MRIKAGMKVLTYIGHMIFLGMKMKVWKEKEKIEKDCKLQSHLKKYHLETSESENDEP